MYLSPGNIIKSTSLLKDTVFENTSIFIITNNSDGAIGFIINHFANRDLNQLDEFKNSKSFALFRGGPVDEEHLFFVHSKPEFINGGQLVSNGIYYGGDFTNVISAIDKNAINSNELKIFIGYCGWDAGELEVELAEGSWTISNDIIPFTVLQ